MGRIAPLPLVVLLFLIGPALGQEAVRVATWNVESLGVQGSNQWERAKDVIGRMGADIVVIQEIDDLFEAIIFPTFAQEAGYPQSNVAGTSGTLSGGLRNGIMSIYPITASLSHTAASLSGDPNANDITRDIYEAHVQVPGAADVLGLFVLHLKASSSSTDDFRRAVEIKRLLQAINAFLVAHPNASYMILGDFNEDLMDGPFGNSFSSLPSSLPASYQLGNDVSFPVVYNPFVNMTSLGALVADATQEDTTTIRTTRETSGRRLDYILYGNGATLLGDEVYNSTRDNGIDDPPIGNFLIKFGPVLASSVSLAASDHYAVFGDFEVPSIPTVEYPGTTEDFVLLTGVNGPPSGGPGQDAKTAQGGDVFTLNYVSPCGFFNLHPTVALGQVFTLSGAAPIGPLAGMWFNLNGAFLLADDATAFGPFTPGLAPIVGNTHTYILPVGLNVDFMVQGLVIASTANNGFFATSDGHRISLVP